MTRTAEASLLSCSIARPAELREDCLNFAKVSLNLEDFCARMPGVFRCEARRNERLKGNFDFDARMPS